MSLAENPRYKKKIYDFVLEASQSMSLTATFNGDWENQVRVTDITNGHEIGRVSGKLGTESTFNYDNPQDRPAQLQCVFEYWQPRQDHWKDAYYLVKADTRTVKEVVCDDAVDEKFRDIEMTVSLNHTDKRKSSREAQIKTLTTHCQTGETLS